MKNQVEISSTLVKIDCDSSALGGVGAEKRQEHLLGLLAADSVSKE